MDKLDEEKELLERIFNQTIDIIIVKDWNGKFVKCSPSLAHLYNTTPEEMVGKDDFDFTGNKEQAEFFKKNAQAIMEKGQREIVIEESTNTENGEVRQFRSIKTPFINHRGEKQIIVVAQDITDIIKLQNEHQFILKAMKVGTWSWDVVNDKLEWSDANYEVFGIDKKDFSGAFDAWEKMVHPEYLKTVKLELQQALDGVRVFNTTFPILTPEKELRYIGGKGEVYRDQAGKPIKMIGVNWDKIVEHLNFLENEERKKILHHQAKLASIGQLAAGVGHEINNPLAIADGIVSILKSNLLKAGTIEIETLLTQLEKVTKAHQRIVKIVQGLKSFSRSDTEELELIDPLETINETLNMISDLYKNAGIEFLLDTTNYLKPVFIYANKGLLQQVFLNLFSNAKQALSRSKDKKIEITLEEKKQEIFIRVKDNGSGIPEEIKDRIFDPFFTTKDLNEGTGLGLSIVYSTVKEFKGKIILKSDVNIGTCFELSFPVVYQQKERQQEGA